MIKCIEADGAVISDRTSAEPFTVLVSMIAKVELLPLVPDVRGDRHMSSVKLAELIQIASNIGHLRDLMDTEEDPREWKKVKATLPAEEERFVRERNAYVDMVLRERPGSDAVETAQRELEEFRSKSHASWNRATDYTIENLIPHLTKESRKSPELRRAVKIMPWAFAIVCIVAYFGIRIFSAVDVSSPFDSREGISQRAAAMEKFVRHDDFMHTRTRRGGWIKGLLFWPIEPTDAEKTGATEFAGLSLQAMDILRNDGQACGGPAIGQGENLSKDEIEFVDQLAEFVRSDRMKWSNEPTLDISVPIRALYPCDGTNT